VATPTRTRLDVETRRAQLIEIGKELFSSRPYEDVWIEEIAERAGISRGLLYHYFPTKRDFYVAVVRAASDEVAQLTQPDPELPPLARLRAGVDAYLDYAERNAHGVLTTHRASIGADPEVRAIIEAGQTRQIQRFIDQMAGDARVPPTLPLILRGWLNLLVNSTVEWLERRTVERETLAQLLANSFVGLVLAARQADPELDRALPPPASE
jgi:AcrR family transcriptional regulator